MVIQQQVSKVDWEKEFSSGKWDGLEFSPLERARHAVIGMFLQQYAPEGSVLDVGCGFGPTPDFLNPVQKSLYLGIDISETAVNEAKKRKNANFLVADFLKFTPEKKFDVLIFNEVLYYLEEGPALRHAMELLREGGLVIISLYSQKKMHYSDVSIWNLCRHFFTPLETIEVRGVVADGRLITWRIEVLSTNDKLKDTQMDSFRQSDRSGFNIKRIYKWFLKVFKHLKL